MVDSRYSDILTSISLWEAKAKNINTNNDNMTSSQVNILPKKKLQKFANLLK